MSNHTRKLFSYLEELLLYNPVVDTACFVGEIYTNFNQLSSVGLEWEKIILTVE